MGIFSKFLNVQKLTLEDVALPDKVESDLGDLTFPETKLGFLKLDIVGESRHQDYIKQIVEVTQGEKFPIFLVPEPGNQYDKNAVRVLVGTQMIGYIAKEQAKVLSKLLMGRIESEKALAFGEASAHSRDGKIYGVFGHVYLGIGMSADPDKVEAKELSKQQLDSIQLKLSKHANSESPETLSKLKSKAKKIEPLIVELLAHALWKTESLSETSEDSDSDWDVLIDECHSTLENFSQLIWATDPEVVYEYDLEGDLENLLELLKDEKTS